VTRQTSLQTKPTGDPTHPSYQIQSIQNKSDWNAFVTLPYQLYQNDPLWVPPLRFEQKVRFSKKKNPMLEHCDHELFLVRKYNQVVGRIAAFVDHLAVEHWKQKVGLFGSYECTDDISVSSMLLAQAETWLKEKKMDRMRGPWNFAAEEWGFVAKGYQKPPMMMSPYNPPYYNDQLEAYGLEKIKDLLVYELDTTSYQLPARYVEFAEKVARKNGVRIRPIRLKNLKEEVKLILRIANESTSGNWGYIPVTGREADELARSLRPILDPELILIAEINARPVGYLIALPDINPLLKKMNGRLFPFGIFRLLTGIKKMNRYRIWALGVIPEYQRKAVDVLFYKRLYEILGPQKPFLEANYVLENNMAMNNPIAKLGFIHSKTFRIYEKMI
jgi:hypothetical protein